MNGYQFLVAVTATCGGLIFGYEIGMMSVVLVMDAFRLYFNLYDWDGKLVNKIEYVISEDYTYDKTPKYRHIVENSNKPFREGFMTSSLILGAIFGSIGANYLAKNYKGKTILLGSAALYIIGSVLQTFSLPSFLFLSLARLIAGVAMGSIYVHLPTYIVEVAPAKIRNFVISCYEGMIAFGIILSCLANGVIWYFTNVEPKEDLNVDNKGWRFAFSVQIILGLLLALFIYNLPDSPRWLCQQLNDKGALKVLTKMNGSTSDTLAIEELKAIQDSIKGMEVHEKIYKPKLYDRTNRRRTFMTFILQFFQQWTGISCILYFQTQLFRGVDFTRTLSYVFLPLINSVVYFVSSLVGLRTISKIGRKPLFIFGSALLVILGFSLQRASDHTLDHYQPYSYASCDNYDPSKDSLVVQRPELNITFYGNPCAQTTLSSTYFCPDNINIISYNFPQDHYFDGDNETTLGMVCNEMQSLRYELGNNHRYIFAGLVFLYTFVYACTVGPVPKVYPAEVFPLNMRIKGTTLNTITHFVCKWFVVFLSPIFIHLWGLGIFNIFIICCVIGAVTTLLCIVETKGLSMEELESLIIN